VSETDSAPEPEQDAGEEQPVRRRPALPPVLQYTTKGLRPGQFSHLLKGGAEELKGGAEEKSGVEEKSAAEEGSGTDQAGDGPPPEVDR
jgi:hypothetical protein